MSLPTLDVLIVGAGPVGLTMGTMLNHHGAEFRIIDKAAAASDKSKALAIWPRSLELLHKAELDVPLLVNGVLGHGASIYADGERLVHVSLDHIDSPYKFVLFIPQSETERVLSEHLQSIGRAVERRVELVSFSDDGDGVDCVLRHPEGDEEKVRARYLVGCDGCHSTVRHVLQMPFEGHTLTSTWALADVQLDGEAPQDELSLFWDADGICGLFPMGGKRFRIIIDQAPGANTEGEPSLEQMQAVLDARAGKPWKLSDPHWITYFTINERKVKDYSRGRVFLAGDAAHIHSPAGGQGMNTGMQDAANLAWKLGMVLKGEASSTLLDSYNAERSAVGEEIVANADRMTTVATLRGSVKQHVRNGIVRMLGHLEALEHRMTNQLAEVLIGYPKSPIVGQHSGGMAWKLSRGIAPGRRVPQAHLWDAATEEETSLFEVLTSPKHVMLLVVGVHPSEEGLANLTAAAKRVGERFPDQVETVMISLEPVAEWKGRAYLEDGMLHRTFGAGHETVYIIRPDGYVGFRSQPVDDTAILQWLDTMFLPSRSQAAV